MTAIVTEEGVVEPPFVDGLAAAVARREARRSTSPRFADLARVAGSRRVASRAQPSRHRGCEPPRRARSDRGRQKPVD